MTTERKKTLLLIIGIILACLLLLQSLGFGIKPGVGLLKPPSIEFSLMKLKEVTPVKIVGLDIRK